MNFGDGERENIHLGQSDWLTRFSAAYVNSGKVSFFDLFLFWGASLAAYGSLSLMWFCLPIWSSDVRGTSSGEMGLEYFNIVPKSRPKLSSLVKWI